MDIKRSVDIKSNISSFSGNNDIRYFENHWNMKLEKILAYYGYWFLPSTIPLFYFFNTILGLNFYASYALACFSAASIYLPLNKWIFAYR